ncbi:MAG: AAA family ATPase [Pseudomonadota bacterium]
MPRYISLNDAAGYLRTARRISVIGVSGAGKSTLSQRLAASLDLRYVSLDRDMRWLPGWTVRDRAEQRARHDGFVAEDRWVIDGTNVSFMDTRLPRSDLVIWMRLPRLVALSGIARRVAGSYGRVRPDMAEGCPEGLPDWEFLSWIWTFERKQAPRIIETVERVAPHVPVVVVRRRVEADGLVRAVA